MSGNFSRRPGDRHPGEIEEDVVLSDSDSDYSSDLGDLVEDDEDYRRRNTAYRVTNLSNLTEEDEDEDGDRQDRGGESDNHPVVDRRSVSSPLPAAASWQVSRGRQMTRGRQLPRGRTDETEAEILAMQRRYSMAAQTKVVSSESKRPMPNTETYYSISQAKARPSASKDNVIREVIEKEKKVIRMPEPAEIAKKVGFKELFRYASTGDKVILACSCFSAICGGALIPVMPIVFSQFAKSFLQVGSTQPVSKILTKYTLYFVYLAGAEFVVIFIATFGLTRVGERITRRIRESYLAALLRQDIEYFSSVGVGECTARLTEDINIIQKGLSEKIARTIHALSTFTCAFVIAFILCWRLAAMLLWSVAFGLMVMGTGIYLSFSRNPKIQQANSAAISLAEEAVSSIRNVKALGAEHRLADRYIEVIKEAGKWATRQDIQLGVSLAITITANYLNVALILWQGSRFIARDDATFAGIFIIELVMTQALYALVGISNHVETFSKALSAAQKVYQTIDRVSRFDATSDRGTKVNPLRGNIKLDSVVFSYPSRPDVRVLDDVDLHFPAGKITALVGPSGSGKSSIIDLILRFFDPDKGHVLIDSVDVSNLNLRWLRRQIGVVNQTPSIFATTFRENIGYGLIGSDYENETEEEKLNRIMDAARAANIHDFIMSLPGQYDAQAGDRGFMMSGGQKQRIAIARALVGNPQILLLDEATSALDSESEEQIVSFLNATRRERTTIVVAHRLSTIKDADKIIVLNKGEVVEEGNHNNLIYTGGAYSKLVKAGKSAEMSDKAIAEYASRKVSSGSNSSSDSTHSVFQSYPASSQLPNPSTCGASVQRSVRFYPEGSQFREPYSRETSTRGSVPACIYPGESQQELRPRAEDGYIELDALGPTGSVQAAQGGSIQQDEKEPKIITDKICDLISFASGFNTKEACLNRLGVICCLFGGAEEAVNAILFGESTVLLSMPKGQYTEMLSKVAVYAWVYLAFALFQLLIFVGKAVFLSISSQRMIERVKDRSFRSALRQDIEYYDATKFSTGTLVSLLSTETTNMCGLSGLTLGSLVIVGSTLVLSTFIALVFGWKLSLVCTATIPFVLGCGYLSVALLGQHSAETSAETLVAANKATEALSDVRTVAILTREGAVLEQYCRELAALEKKSLMTVVKVSMVYALCQSIIFLCMALGFWFGGRLVARGEITPLNFFIIFTSVVFGARSAGFFFSFAEDISKVIKGTQLVKNLLERDVKIDTWSRQGLSPDRRLLGAIQFVRLSFKYPGHDKTVLKNMSFSVMPQDHIALVGPSGCGKSSIMSLLERFYNPDHGSIYIDGDHIKNFRLKDLRRNLALVSQDVTLYEGTIRENIVLGVDELPGADFEVMLKKAIACANLTEFIDSLPSGLYTKIGSKGCMLSGGQKQRIAIARAVLRNPAILLLDEATSALDSESELVVQEALNKASKGRTTITIAHRLNTVRNADKIYYIEEGKIVERGTHAQLMKLDGRYAHAVKLQEMVKEVEQSKLAPSISFIGREFIEELASEHGL